MWSVPRQPFVVLSLYSGSAMDVDTLVEAREILNRLTDQLIGQVEDDKENISDWRMLHKKSAFLLHAVRVYRPHLLENELADEEDLNDLEDDLVTVHNLIIDQWKAFLNND